MVRQRNKSLFTKPSNFNPQNTSRIPAVKIFAFLELEQIISFMDGHESVCLRLCFLPFPDHLPIHFQIPALGGQIVADHDAVGSCQKGP